MNNYAHVLALIEYVSTLDVLDLESDVSRVTDGETGEEFTEFLTNESRALVEMAVVEDGKVSIDVRYQTVSPGELARIGAFFIQRSLVAMGMLTDDGEIVMDVADAMLDEALACDRDSMN